MKGAAANRPQDAVAGLSDAELRAMLVTLDGRGAANKSNALDELLRRAISASAAYVRSSGHLTSVVDLNSSDVDMDKWPGIRLPDTYKIGQRVRVLLEPE